MNNLTDNQFDKNVEQYHSTCTMIFCAALTNLEKDILRECLEQYTRQNGLPRYRFYNNGYNIRSGYYSDVAKIFEFDEIELSCCTLRFSKTKSFFLTITINPRKIYHSENSTDVHKVSTEDVALCIKGIKSMLKSIGAPRKMIKLFKLTKINFCTSIHLVYPHNAKQYMMLLLKGAYSTYFRRCKEDGIPRTNHVPTRDYFFISSPTVEYAIYNKHQLLSKAPSNYSAEEIQNSEGLIQIELRISRPVISHKKNPVTPVSDEIFLEHTNRIAMKFVPQYIKRAYGTGKFTSLDNAKRIVYDSNYKSKTKEELIFILEQVSKKHSLQQVTNTMPDKLYKKCMRKFNELGISPITFYRSIENDEYPSLLDYMQYRNTNTPN